MKTLSIVAAVISLAFVLPASAETAVAAKSAAMEQSTTSIRTSADKPAPVRYSDGHEVEMDVVVGE